MAIGFVLRPLTDSLAAGYSRWNGRLLAEHLGQVSKDQVWRVMRKHHLSLARRQSWCVSTDPEFSRKGVGGLYLKGGGALFEPAREPNSASGS